MSIRFKGARVEPYYGSWRLIWPNNQPTLYPKSGDWLWSLFTTEEAANKSAARRFEIIEEDTQWTNT